MAVNHTGTATANWASMKHQYTKEDLVRMRSWLTWIPIENIKITLENTTQIAKDAFALGPLRYTGASWMPSMLLPSLCGSRPYSVPNPCKMLYHRYPYPPSCRIGGHTKTGHQCRKLWVLLITIEKHWLPVGRRYGNPKWGHLEEIQVIHDKIKYPRTHPHHIVVGNGCVGCFGVVASAGV
jgi:hypothetical protein